MLTIGIGVIGCGDIARVRYFPTIDAMPEFALKGLLSRTSRVCEPLAARYGGTIHPDLDAILSDPEIEAVVIATPHPSHAELSIRSLEAGKHVLSEKPMATSLADANLIHEAAARSGRVYMALPFDESPPIKEVKRLVDSGVIGQVSSADAVLAHRGPKHAPWFFDREQAGWGVSADLGIYLVSQLTYLFGPAERVLGRVNTVIPERTAETGGTITVTVDDNASAILEWPNRILATVRANWCSPSDHRNVICETRVYGTTGMIVISLASKTNPIAVYAPQHAIPGAATIEFNGVSNWQKPACAPWDADQDILRSFAEQIWGDRLRPGDRSNVAHQRHVIEIIDRLYASSESGRAMTLGQG